MKKKINLKINIEKKIIFLMNTTIIEIEDPTKDKEQIIKDKPKRTLLRKLKFLKNFFLFSFLSKISKTKLILFATYFTLIGCFSLILLFNKNMQIKLIESINTILS